MKGRDNARVFVVAVELAGQAYGVDGEAVVGEPKHRLEDVPVRRPPEVGWVEPGRAGFTERA